MFGLIGVDSVEIKYPSKTRDSRYHRVFPSGSHATSVVETVGMFLFALYHVSTIIVLINMLHYSQPTDLSNQDVRDLGFVKVLSSTC